MKTIAVTIVGVYITESSDLLRQITHYLQKEVKIRGMTAFRAIDGFGESGSHSSFLVDFSLNLPLTIEFFDDQDKIKKAINLLSTIIKPEHINILGCQSQCRLGRSTN